MKTLYIPSDKRCSGCGNPPSKVGMLWRVSYLERNHKRLKLCKSCRKQWKLEKGRMLK